MGYRILIVDGDPLMRALLCDILKEERAHDQVEVVDSAQEALASMRHEPANILITDWQMPDMDGLTLIEAVQLLHPKTHAILMTAADQDEVKERRRNRPASFTSFTKPFSIEAFLAHVDQALTQTDQFGAAQGNSDTSDRRSQSALRPALGWG